MSSFTGALVTRHHQGELIVDTPFEFHVAAPESNLFVRVERGFQTDLASIPWWMTWLFPKHGKYDRPAVVHDKLYRLPVLLSRAPYGDKETRITRMECDYLFFQAMLADDVNPYKAFAMALAVRCFGWVWFDVE